MTPANISARVAFVILRMLSGKGVFISYSRIQQETNISDMRFKWQRLSLN
jgi:hypothetical protein